MRRCGCAIAACWHSRRLVWLSSFAQCIDPINAPDAFFGHQKGVTMTIASRRHLFHAFIAMSAVISVAGPASSLVLPANAGHPSLPGDTCFEISSFSAVSNLCGSARWFVVPIVTTNNANHVAAARYAGNGSSLNATSCKSVARSGDGFSSHGSLSIAVSSHTPQVVTFGNVFVAVDETLQVECLVAQKLPSGVTGFVVSIGA